MLCSLLCLINEISTVSVEVSVSARLTVLCKLMTYIWKPSVWTASNIPLLHKLGVLVDFAEIGIRHILRLVVLRNVLLVYWLRWHLVNTLLMCFRIRENSSCVLAGKRGRNVWLLIWVLFFLLIVAVSTVASRCILRFFMPKFNIASTLSGRIVVTRWWLFPLLVGWRVTRRGAFIRPELHAN